MSLNCSFKMANFMLYTFYHKNILKNRNKESRTFSPSLLFFLNIMIMDSKHKLFIYFSISLKDLLCLAYHIAPSSMLEWLGFLCIYTPAQDKIWKMFSVAEDVLFSKWDKPHFSHYSTHKNVIWHALNLSLSVP